MKPVLLAQNAIEEQLEGYGEPEWKTFESEFTDWYADLLIEGDNYWRYYLALLESVK